MRRLILILLLIPFCVIGQNLPDLTSEQSFRDYFEKNGTEGGKMALSLGSPAFVGYCLQTALFKYLFHADRATSYASQQIAHPSRPTQSTHLLPTPAIFWEGRYFLFLTNRRAKLTHLCPSFSVVPYIAYDDTRRNQYASQSRLGHGHGVLLLGANFQEDVIFIFCRNTVALNTI